jgi:putative ABC transport system permease protein
LKLQSIILLWEAGVDGMRGNAMRTALSTVGVVIGVASLVGVLSLGDGMERYVRNTIGKERVQLVRVSARTSRWVEGRRMAVPNVVQLTARHVEEVRRLPHVAEASLRVGGIATYRAGAEKEEGVETMATPETGADFDQLQLAHGRFFVYGEAARDAPVVVISRGLAKKLSGQRPYLAMLEDRVWVANAQRRVVGIIDQDHPLAYIPLRSAGDVIGRGARDFPPQMVVRASSIEVVEQVRSELEDWAAIRFGAPDERLEFSTYADRVEQATEGIAVFKAVMGAIIGISLLVGGIGVMNVLLASVAERTREIGIRRALGAHRRSILVQFLFESMAITGLGSLFGIILGTLGAFAIAPVIKSMTGQSIPVAPSISTLLLAVACPTLVGLVFGIYPAHRASRLSPIEALRHE